MLPRGLVTFVLTDIEGSTTMFRELGGTYAHVLADHDRLLRGAMEAHGGVEIGNEGDSLLMAFESPRDAILACIEGQISLVDHEWHEGHEVRVRMGAHTGEAEPVDGRYVSLAIHQVARISAGAHGGQVLISEATAEMVEGNMPEGASLELLGSYQLRGFARPEKIYQLVHPRLQATFPPIRAMGVVAHNLPILRTSFIGRETEISALSGLIENTGLVSIVGPGGVGKTRLAMQLAHSTLDRFPDGAWLVELAAIGAGDPVDRAVASTFGIAQEPNKAPREQIIAALRTKRLLLILDNCEHVLAPVAELVSDINTHCPDVVVVATSREPLDVDGEVVWRLKALATTADGASTEPSAAARLFVERARLVQPSLDPSDSDWESIEEIVHHLNGIPLAVELAAATLGERSIAGVLDGLSDRFSLLTQGRRTAPSRHQTLRNAIEWSLDLLPSDERTVFDRLGVFAGDWSTEAAVEVCGFDPVDPASVAGLLPHLARASLITSDLESGRWSMLESMRELAVKELGAGGEADDVALRHAEWCAGMTRALFPLIGRRGHSDVAAALEAEQANIRKAVEFAAGSGHADLALQICAFVAPYWTSHGDWSTGIELGRQALAAGGSAALRSQVQAAMGRMSLLSGDIAQAGALFRKAATGAPSDEHIVGARASLGLGLVAFRGSRLDEAEAHWDEALEHAELAGDHGVRAEVLRSKAIAAGTRGDQNMTGALIDQAIQSAEVAQDDQLVRLLLTSRAEMRLWLGAYRGAEDAYEEALELADEIGDLSARPLLLAELGWMALLRGEPQRAKRLGDEALALAEELHNPRVTAHAYRLVAESMLRIGQYDEASAHLDQALTIARDLDAPSEVAGVLTSRAAHALHLGQWPAARALAEEADELGGLTHSLRLETPEWVHGVAALQTGDLNEAEQRFETVMERGDGMGIPRYLANGLWGLAGVSNAREDWDAAIDFAQRAAQLRHEMGDALGLADAVVALAGATATREPGLARQLIEAAAGLRHGVGAVPSPLQVEQLSNVAAIIGIEFDDRESPTPMDIDGAYALAAEVAARAGAT